MIPATPEQQAAELIAQARREHSPLQGDFAAHVWMWSNHPGTPVALAERTMLACGYRPFAGYPLQRVRRV